MKAYYSETNRCFLVYLNTVQMWSVDFLLKSGKHTIINQKFLTGKDYSEVVHKFNNLGTSIKLKIKDFKYHVLDKQKAKSLTWDAMLENELRRAKNAI